MYYIMKYEHDGETGEVRVEMSREIIRGIPRIKKKGYYPLKILKVYEGVIKNKRRRVDVTSKYRKYF